MSSEAFSVGELEVNSFYLVFIVVIVYSQQISIFMKQPWSTIIVL